MTYARGDTLWDALLALIPRAIWPDKPITAGSGNLVSRYHRHRFAAGTSVGVGQVMEFYANFGTLGVVIGFMIMGVFVTALDWQAANGWRARDLHGFVLWFLPGIALLQVGGQLVEIDGQRGGQPDGGVDGESSIWTACSAGEARDYAPANAGSP